MNTPGPEYDEREWLAQERALREVRYGIPLPSEDITVSQYRDIANALRQPPVDALPPDFAERVARIAGEPARESRFEQILMRTLATAFALSALAALGIYGGRLLAMLQSATDADGLRWTFGLAACLAVSWSLDWMRRRLHHGDRDGSADGGAQAA